MFLALAPGRNPPSDLPSPSGIHVLVVEVPVVWSTDQNTPTSGGVRQSRLGIFQIAQICGIPRLTKGFRSSYWDYWSNRKYNGHSTYGFAGHNRNPMHSVCNRTW